MKHDALQNVLDRHTLPAELAASSEKDGKPGCTACAHKCRLPRDGDRGVCRLRFNREGTVMAPRGYVAALGCDPIEKKPLYHFLAGERAFSFGMLGCNFQCEFCQNWISSQALKEPRAGGDIQLWSAEGIVESALRHNCRVVASTYNEPLITSEWAVEIFRLARERGLAACYVTNGFASPEVLSYLAPWLDAVNVDLKCFTEASYRRLGGRLQPVLDTIQSLHARGKWVETTTLIVPEFNDGEEELRELAGFLASVDPLMPWHISAYHADYKMRGSVQWTPVESLQRAAEIGREAGLKYIYFGNLRGSGEYVDTHCHNCGSPVVRRSGFSAAKTELFEDGNCPRCKAAIPGRWSVN